jgi:FHA domain/zinc-ribbon domain
VTVATPPRSEYRVGMRCRQCGHQNESGANFCSSCGSPLPQEDEATLSLTELAERLELDEELGAALAELPEGMGMLVVRRGPNAGSRYVLDAEVTALGRHPDSDIFLDDITVSRRHAAVRRVEGRYEVSDVGSLNGTYVDHERVDTAPLHHLADLQIGRFVLVFLVGSDQS